MLCQYYLAKWAENARAKASPLLLASSVPPSLATAYHILIGNLTIINYFLTIWLSQFTFKQFGFHSLLSTR